MRPTPDEMVHLCVSETETVHTFCVFLIIPLSDEVGGHTCCCCWERFHNINIPSVQHRHTIVLRCMNFLGKVIRGSPGTPSTALVYVDNPRPRGRPITSTKASLIKSLQIFGQYNGFEIDDMGSLKFWYRDKWEKCLERFKKRDPDDETPPQRPSRDENPSEEHRHQYNTRSSAAAPPPSPPPRKPPPSPPRERRDPDPPRSNRNESREYDPEGVGHNIKESLSIFGLERGAVWMDVKAEFRLLSRLYHPDKHNPTRTKMTNEGAKAFFQLFNNVKDFLEKHFERTGQCNNKQLKSVKSLNFCGMI